ncbi:MAG: alpha-glucosidase [Spirochaetaceae bacterium]|nr:alpha-glucosidase [Spirochaetaceae bacterium]|tara:strand:- start:348097 stop:350496 length:2400 start_codon:yes stop_codon:yes gene_type:complete
MTDQAKEKFFSDGSPMPEIQQRNTHSVMTQIAGNNAFRFCIFPEPAIDIPADPELTTEGYQTIPVHRDAEGKAVSKKKDFRFAYDPPTGIFRLDAGADEVLSGQFRMAEYPLDRIRIVLERDEMLYGLGAASGEPNRMDQEFLLRTMDTQFYSLPGQTYSSFPFFLLRKGHRFRALYLHTSYPQNVTTISDPSSEEGASIIVQNYRPEGPLPVDLFCFVGGLKDILDAYTALTGRPIHPPLWSMGFHQSRWSYKTADKVREIAEGFRGRDLPCDAIHLDIHYMDRYRVFTWNQKRFPDPEGLHRELEEKGIRTVAIVDPGVYTGDDYSVYQDGLKQDLYCKEKDSDNNFLGKVWPGPTVFPDFIEEKTRIWWASHHKTLFDAGVSGIWNDMNEPVLQIGKTTEPLDLPVRHQSGSHLQFRNLYGNYEAKATRDGFRRWKPGQRAFILTRSGTCGIQKYAALWTGDNHSSWEHLKANLHMVVNLGLTGVPLSGADVGGFCSGPGQTGAFKLFKNKELFARWMELGSLMPFFRVHTVLYSHDQEPWSFGDEVLEISRKHMNRRYRLMHYISGLIYGAHRTGEPLVRPVWYEFPEMQDSELDSQFMLGSELLACPVLEPGKKKRKVILPPGEWFEFESGRRFVGGQAHCLDTRPGYYPLFVRGGAVLPTCPARRNAEESVRAGLHIELYPAETMKGTVLLDDGITEGQIPTRIEVQGSQSRTGQLTIEIDVQPGEYDPPYRNFKLRLPGVFRHMLGSNAVSGTAVDATREDRSLDMISFELPLQSDTYQFDFRNVIQGSSDL